MREVSPVLIRIKQAYIHGWHSITWQAVLTLLGRSEETVRLIGEVYDEEAMVPEHRKVKNETALSLFHLNKLILAFRFGDYVLAEHCGEALNDNEFCLINIRAY